MSIDQVKPFSISVEEAVLGDLWQRISETRWSDEVDADPWHYDPLIAYMRSFADHWLNDYDWRREEARLNELSQFTTEIDGLSIHFIHEQGVGPDPMPLVLTHGWPGNFIEIRRIIPILTTPVAYGGRAADAFTAVVLIDTF